MWDREVNKKYYLSPDKVNRLLSIPKDKHGPTLLDKNSAYARTLTTRIGSSGNFEQYILEVVDDPTSMRRFTPRESWRFMGFDDADIEKALTVCSDNQLYKQAGNSIVVNVLMEIFEELFCRADEGLVESWML